MTSNPPRRQPVSCYLPWLFSLLSLGIALVSCASDSTDTVSAGAHRDAPAEVSPLPDTGTDEDPTAPDGDDPATDPASPGDSSPDRILREGAVGTITVVTDGDTVHVTVDGWYHRVRLYGINAPECEKTRQQTADGYQYVCSQDQEWWGLSSAEALIDFALGNEVTVHCDQSPGQACPTDSYDRFLAFLDSDAGDLSEYQVRNGHALTFTRYQTTRMATYCEAEYQAIEEGLGMWSLGDREEVLARMNESTQDWYQDHDAICAELME